MDHHFRITGELVKMQMARSLALEENFYDQGLESGVSNTINFLRDPFLPQLCLASIALSKIGLYLLTKEQIKAFSEGG